MLKTGKNRVQIFSESEDNIINGNNKMKNEKKTEEIKNGKGTESTFTLPFQQPCLSPGCQHWLIKYNYD